MASKAGRRSFVVRGVVQAAEAKGVHGVEVRLVDQLGLLGKSSTLTHADGAFTLSFDSKLHATAFRRRPAWRLEFFDRDGKLLHRQAGRGRFGATTGASFRISLAAAKLAGHFSRPLTLVRRGGRLLPDKRVDVIRDALRRMPNLDTARHAMLLMERPCPFPPLDHFEDLLDDIWGTLDGDPLARRRFEDVVEILVAGQAAGVARGPNDLRSVAAPRNETPKLERLIDELKLASSSFAPVEGLLGRDALVPLLMATAYTFGGNATALDIGLRAVLGSLRGYRHVAALANAAEQSLGGGEGGERRLMAIFGTLDDLCGDGDPFPPGFDLDDFDPGDLERIEHWGCTAEAALAVARLRGTIGFPPRVPLSTETYRIDSVEPAMLCAGDEITLTGAGFTDEPGLVRFAGGRERHGRPIDVAATSWSDTEIIVTVPPEAACGPLELRIVEESRTVQVCDAFLDYSTYRRAEAETLFEGCQPRIGFFGLLDADRCATVGSESRVGWRVDPEDAEVEVTVRKVGVPAVTIIPDAEAHGSTRVDTSEVATFTFTITARNPASTCDEASQSFTLTIAPPPPTLSILGVEMTQGIQRFSLTDPTVASNSVGMIANMDTVVRVFVASDRGTGFSPNARVGGRLVCAGQVYFPINGTPRGSAPIITAGASPQRSVTDDSLNFLIPAARARGAASLDVEVFTVDVCDGDASASSRTPIEWVVREAYPVTVRRISEPGTGAVVTEAEALELIDQAFDRLPSPRTEYRVFPGTFTIHAGTTESNYCHDGGYYQLALSVAYEHNGVEGLWPDPHESAWIGLYMNFGCTAGGMMSWPWTSTCISERDPEVMAHELAHVAGMGHTVTSAGERCEDVAQPVACHRLPNDATLADVVFDIRANTARPSCPDLMSYRSGFRYFHPDHWESCRDHMDGRF